MPGNLLLSGSPGVGKTTALRRVASQLPEDEIRGFLTDEIRRKGTRVGFRIESLDGRAATLAHVEIDSPHRVGRYRVDVSALDRMIDVALRDEEAKIYIVDEIGKMECFSLKFIEVVRKLLSSPKILIATIGTKGGGFIAEVKERRDVEIWNVTRQNRDDIPVRVLEWMSRRRSCRSQSTTRPSEAS